MAESCELKFTVRNPLEEVIAAPEPDCREVIKGTAMGGSSIIVGGLRL